jgi:hypothetical protein
MMDYNRVTHRDIAKMLVSGMPLSGEQFSDKVEAYIEAINNMSIENKTALKMAYIFSRKVPREEREDVFQDLALSLFKAQAPGEKLAYTIARYDWKDWYRKYSIRQHTSLDSVVENDNGTGQTLAELLVGTVEYTELLDGKLQAERIWNILPDNIKRIVSDRLKGKSLNKTDRNSLNYYARTHGASLLMA